MIFEKPGNRLTAPQCGHMALLRSSVSSISVESLSEFDGRNSANDNTAFIAGDIGLISADNADQTAAALRVPEIRMGSIVPMI